MGNTSQKRDVAVSMRFRGEDLDVIDRGADLNQLSRSDFVRFIKAVDGPALECQPRPMISAPALSAVPG